jgi:hypothetical protein
MRPRSWRAVVELSFFKSFPIQATPVGSAFEDCVARPFAHYHRLCACGGITSCSGRLKDTMPSQRSAYSRGKMCCHRRTLWAKHGRDWGSTRRSALSKLLSAAIRDFSHHVTVGIPRAPCRTSKYPSSHAHGPQEVPHRFSSPSICL